MFKEKILGSIYTGFFEEFFIRPGLSEKEPYEIDLRTKFSRNIILEIPISSSPMDTVSGYEMAVAIALLGGIGVVHRNMSIEEQVSILKKVKEAPPIRTREIFLTHDQRCQNAIEYMRRNEIRDLPVLKGSAVVGRVRYIDLEKECVNNDPVEKYVREPVKITLKQIRDAKRIIMEGGYDTIAVTDDHDNYLGTIVYKDLFQENSPSLDEEGRLIVGAAVSPFDKERILKIDKYADVIVTDVAHFHNRNVINATKMITKEISKDLVIGNLATEEAVRDVVSEIDKIDGFRVGLGGGSICITPEVTGVYMPTLYAVAEVRDAVDKLNMNVPVIADGGIRSSADIMRALAAGASSVMLGYMLAGTEEASAPKIRVGGSVYKPYRGMASISAIELRYAMDRYSRRTKQVAEGIEGLVPYKGSVYKIVQEIIEALKAGFGYAGASNIEELWRKTVFIRTKPRDSRDIIQKI